jgi:hypothetical protein
VEEIWKIFKDIVSESIEISFQTKYLEKPVPRIVHQGS